MIVVNILVIEVDIVGRQVVRAGIAVGLDGVQVTIRSQAVQVSICLRVQ